MQKSTKVHELYVSGRCMGEGGGCVLCAGYVRAGCLHEGCVAR